MAGISAEPPADHFDEVFGQMRNVAESFMFDLAVFAEGSPKEISRVDLAFVFPVYLGYMNWASS